jgi:monofunctional biosynthetic peptidoglycan transglycosylase
MQIQKILKNRWVKGLLKGIKYFLIISISLTIFYKFIPVLGTPLMVQRGLEQSFGSRSYQFKKDWTSLDQISPHLVLAVLCSEDQNFLEHSGLDFEAIEDAMAYNERQKKMGKTKTRGASTISQQTAKNVFLLPTRSWIRKGLEVYFTYLIEIIWSKRRIMEVYLNIIEIGNGIYGAEAAAQHFFNKKASQLTKDEAALLAAVLPNPLGYNVAKPTAKLLRKKRWILRQMANNRNLIFE